MREQMKSFNMPHPLVSLSGIAIIGLLLYLSSAFHFHLPNAFLVALVIAFAMVGRWSARREKEKRLRKLEELRHTPVLHLNE